MDSIKTLVLMQLKEKLNLKGRNIKSKYTFFNAIFAIIKFAAVVAIGFGIIYVCKLLHIFSIVGGFPAEPLVAVFTIMFVLSIFGCTVKLDKALYFSNDNPLLLTLPCKPGQVFLSKLIVFYIFELIKNYSFMVPLFIAYGISGGLAVSYYFWVLFVFIFISMIPVLIGAILSIPTMYIYNIFRQYKTLQIVSLLAFVFVIAFGVIKVIALIPSNINFMKTWGKTYWQIQDILKHFSQNNSGLGGFKTLFNFASEKGNYRTVISTSICEILIGSKIQGSVYYKLFSKDSFVLFGIMIGFIVVLATLSILLVHPLFYKMASKPFEYKKMNKKQKPNKIISRKVSIIKNEFTLCFRDTDRLFSAVITMLTLPILIFLLNKIYGAMSTKALGNYLEIAFNTLLILVISLTTNTYAASVYSKDGRSSYLIKVQPSKYQPLLFAKLLFNTAFMTIGFIATYIVIYKVAHLTAMQSLFLVGGCYLIYLAHTLYSANQDIMNPQLELYANIGNSDNNPNETNSMVLAFILSLLVCGIVLKTLSEKDTLLQYIKVFGIGLVLLGYELYSFTENIKLFYKEK